MKHKAEIVNIDDDDCASGWECSFLDEYVLETEEEDKDEKENQEEEEEEGWEEKLLGFMLWMNRDAVIWYVENSCASVIDF